QSAGRRVGHGAGDWFPPPQPEGRQSGLGKKWAGAACNSPARGNSWVRGIAMSTITRYRKARQRTGKLAPPNRSQPGSAGVVEFRQNGKLDRYLTERVPSDFGSGYLLRKMGGEQVYHVHLTADGNTCECQGLLRWQPATSLRLA